MIGKRGQLLERPFIFIFIMVVSALVFIFGFYLINNLIKTSNCAQIGLFVDNLEKEVNRYYSFDTGSSTEITLKLPRKIEYICFYDFKEEMDKSRLDKIKTGLYDVLKGSDNNLVFVPFNYCGRSFFKIKNINVKENPVCVLNTGNIKLNLENKGETVEISK